MNSNGGKKIYKKVSALRWLQSLGELPQCFFLTNFYLFERPFSERKRGFPFLIKRGGCVAFRGDYVGDYCGQSQGIMQKSSHLRGTKQK